MKLRFDHQSIRLRVRKSDINLLSSAGFIVETVNFPLGTLVFKLEIDIGDNRVSAVIKDQTITVSIPADQASEWIQSEAVGIYSKLSTAREGEFLEVLIEKDFPCKHNSADDNADTFKEFGIP